MSEWLRVLQKVFQPKHLQMRVYQIRIGSKNIEIPLIKSQTQKQTALIFATLYLVQCCDYEVC